MSWCCGLRVNHEALSVLAIVITIICCFDNKRKRMSLDLLCKVREGFSVRATYIHGALSVESNCIGHVIDIILSEAVKGIVRLLLYLLVDLTENSVLSSMVYFASVLECNSFNTFDRDLQLVSLWKLLDSTVDESHLYLCKYHLFDFVEQICS